MNKNYHYSIEGLKEGIPLSNPDAPFETILYDGRKIQFVNDHIRRFENAITQLNYTLSFKTDQLFQDLKSRLTNNICRIKVSYIYKDLINITITPLTENINLDFSLKTSIYNYNDYQRLLLFKIQNRSIYETYKKRIDNKRYNDILLLSPDGNILETSIANIFFLKGKTFYTPLNGYFLKGVMRNLFIHFLKEIGYQQFDSKITISEIKDFDHVVVTNAIKRVSNVTEIDNIKFNKKDGIKKQFLNYLNDQ